MQGVTTTVVHDVVTGPDGEVLEDTFDWYAQDTAGNVWYFGEDTTEFDERGRPDTAGSWEAGVDGAQAGIVMLGDAAGRRRLPAGVLRGRGRGPGDRPVARRGRQRRRSARTPTCSRPRRPTRSSPAWPSASTTPAGSGWSTRRASPAASTASELVDFTPETLTRRSRPVAAHCSNRRVSAGHCRVGGSGCCPARRHRAARPAAAAASAGGSAGAAVPGEARPGRVRGRRRRGWLGRRRRLLAAGAADPWATAAASPWFHSCWYWSGAPYPGAASRGRTTEREARNPPPAGRRARTGAGRSGRRARRPGSAPG